MEPKSAKMLKNENYRGQFEKIKAFLVKYEKILVNVPLRSYPNHLIGYEKEWIDEFKNKDMEFLDSVENKRSCE